MAKRWGVVRDGLEPDYHHEHQHGLDLLQRRHFTRPDVSEYELNRADDRTSICPHCGRLNPGIRRVPAFITKAGCTVIYSCAKCKKILSIETVSVDIEKEHQPDVTTDA